MHASTDRTSSVRGRLHDGERAATPAAIWPSVAGGAAALLVALGVWVGSRGLRYFDAALIGYARARWAPDEPATPPASHSPRPLPASSPAA